MENNKQDKKSKKGYLTVISILIVIVALVIVMVKGVTVKEDNKSISISGGIFYSVDLDYSDIENVELRDNIKCGNRNNGFGGFGYNLGNYSNSEFGKYKLFIKNSIDKVVVITYDEDKVVAFNTKDEEETEKMYNTLIEKLEK